MNSPLREISALSGRLQSCIWSSATNICLRQAGCADRRAGRDVLTCGAGPGIFVLTKGKDIITNFHLGQLKDLTEVICYEIGRGRGPARLISET